MKKQAIIYSVIGGVCFLIAVLAVYTINKNGVPTFGNWEACDKVCVAKNEVWNRQIDANGQCICLPVGQ